MPVPQRWYEMGLGLLLTLVLTGELIWLPDPIRLGTHTYWIDIVDYLLYVLALVPLLWMGAALSSMLALKKSGSGLASARWAWMRSAAVLAAGTISIVFILTMPKQLIYSAGSLAAVWLLVVIDLMFAEASRRRRKIPVRMLAGLLATIGLLALFFWPTRYLVTYPGLTLNMNRYAQAGGGSGHGDISGVLVFERPAFPVDWAYARLFPHYAFEPDNLGMSLGEYNQLVRTMKDDANAAGSAVAFQKLGLGSGVTSRGVLITAIAVDSPAKDKLQLGDVIEAVSGSKVASVQELAERMKLVKPGEQVDVTVRRGGASVRVAADTRANPEDATRAAFGIQVGSDLEYDIPRPVDYHSYLLHEGGPSHGAMLALAITDQLTPGGVTNGNHVAGTGTMEPDGSVGPVGGLEQKAYTVSRTNADVFFVPDANEAEARKGAPDLQIVPVHTLDDILGWLRDHPKIGQ